jgi:hypothetical protein
MVEAGNRKAWADRDPERCQFPANSFPEWYKPERESGRRISMLARSYFTAARALQVVECIAANGGYRRSKSVGGDGARGIHGSSRVTSGRQFNLGSRPFGLTECPPPIEVWAIGLVRCC